MGPTFTLPNSLLTDSKKLNSRLSFIFIVSLHELFIFSSCAGPWPSTSAPELIDANLGLIPIIILLGWELVLIELYFAAGVSVGSFFAALLLMFVLESTAF